ncbi:MAG: hypothetical protein E7363_01050 [Clostridiales bacterium]|nr:hypothetical protein [Clostridiales bacterium]
MNGLKRAEMTERRVFSEEDELELLRTDTPTFLSEEEMAKEQNNRISENYKKLLAFDVEEAEPVVAPDFIQEMQGETAPEMEAETVDEADLNPTSTTMQFVDREIDEDFFIDRTPVKAKAVSLFRNKAVIIAYAIVIMTLISLIAVNAVALSRERLNVNALKNEISLLQQESNALDDELESLLDETTVTDNALSSGMTTNGNNVHMNLLTPVEVSEPTLKGNWFNSFCDFFTGIFG